MTLGNDDIPETALAWHRAGRGAVLATVVETWGSAPRQAGSQLVVAGDGQMMGSVSGGCVEGAVAVEAETALADGKPRLLTYGVSDDAAFAVGLACGGTIRVLVEPVGTALPVDVLDLLVQARAAKRPVALVTDLASFEHALTDGPEVADRLRSDKTGVEATETGPGRLVAVHNPALRLIVVGAVHIAQALLPMARACGYAPVLIDPRGAFGSEARFPGEVIAEDWPDEALTALAPDRRTAIVTLTHDSKLDDPAIRTALRSDAFYVGCLGSKRTHAKRVERLLQDGFTQTEIARIHAPVGLDVGAKSPAEIAVAILAQITQVLRKA